LICARRVATLISTFFDMSTSALPVIPAGPAADSCCPAPVGLDRALDAARIAEIAGALAEPVRVNILDVLRRSADPVCQCELVPLFEMPQSTLAHHLKKLVGAGLVVVERRHRWAYYSLAPNALEELTAWLS
jgi:ArsR family transcriptional regulator, arsenate/arsenite/antimonite-responsive transcriptional repressor